MEKAHRLLALLLCVLLALTAVPGVRAESGMICTQQELLAALSAAKDGDVLLVGDIDFTAPDGIFNEMMRFELRKSVTLRSGIPGGKAVFTNGSVLLLGSKVSGQGLECHFEDIIFDGNIDTAALTAKDWERPYDESLKAETSDLPLKAQYAVSFAGNVTASFRGCVFRNYMYEYGGAMWCRYRDYTDNPYYLDLYGDYSGCKLEITLENCEFQNNAALYAGGAVYLDGNENNVTFRAVNCTFQNNFSTLNDLGQGGGGIYAQYATVALTNCLLSHNEGNRHNGMEALDGDRTRGGGIHMLGGELTLTNCVLRNNTASLGGGLCLTNTSTTIDGCVLAENQAVNAVASKLTGPWASVGLGGGMYVETEAAIPVRIYNTSIYHNRASIAYGGIYGFYNEDYPGLLSQGYGKLELYFCTVADNICDTVYDYSDPELWAWYTHPGDVWDIPYVTATGCIISEKDGKTEQPTAENRYNCYGDSVALTESNGHLISTGWEIPADFAQEVLGGRYGNRLDSFHAGSNYDSSLYREEEPEELPTNSATVPTEAQPSVPTKTPQKSGGLWVLVPVSVLILGGLLLLHFRRKKPAQPAEAPAPQIVLTRYSPEQIEKILRLLPQTQRLTPRELEVFQEMLTGKKQGEIAYELGISVPTVKDNARRIYDKLEVQNKSELFVKAQSVLE